MTDSHAEKLLAAAYVLSALDEPERSAFAQHMAGCAECAEEVRSLQAVADALAASAPQITPRPELRARVLAAVVAGPRTHHAAVVRVRLPLRQWLPTAALALLSIGLGFHAASLQQRMSTLEVRLDEASRRASTTERAAAESRSAADRVRTAMVILSAPDLTRLELGGQPVAAQASGRAFWSRDRGLLVTARRLPALRRDRTYQVWVLAGGAPISAGLLQLDERGDGELTFRTPAEVATIAAVAITEEPSGGVPAPTGEKYLVGTPAARF